MRLAEGLKVRKVAGETLLVPSGKAVKTIRQTALLNEDAAYFVSLMVDDFTIDDIVKKSMEYYCNVTEEQMRTDIEKLISMMKKAGMIIGDSEEDGSIAETTHKTEPGKTYTISGTVRI